eukprot:CAMPEP_0171572224 /NCGR_PEP_ID=MMETSP0961-20121227/4003_1 /TAXON_ID=87120 /ORGANISM="Aurantiochytrium limacinum, Strain ATCCMYA-1381" /LENGTH=470 /DNA_ID=CAMNT_0012127045 /DNA_START=102 /DNA_END=1514 /DNA_ORIENTATION=-
MPSSAEQWRICTRPTVAAEWDREYESRSSEWWEYFFDLVFVAAMTNIAEGFTEALYEEPYGEHALAQAVTDFISQYTLFYSGWFQYLLYTTRFIDTSLMHSAILFVHIWGTAGMVVNAGTVESRFGFGTGVIIQRIALFAMMFSISVVLPRGRRQAYAEMLHVTPGIVILTVGFLLGLTTGYMQALLVAISVWELAYPLLQTSCAVLSRQAVPIHIDHMQERLGSFAISMLSESVVSSVTSYRKVYHCRTYYYIAMTMSLFITFAIALIYFAIVPPRHLNALRRSKYSGVAMAWAHWALGISLVSMGVAVKLILKVILQPEFSLLRLPWYWMFMGSLGLTLSSMYSLRLLHWYGRQPAPSDPPQVRKIKYIWWIGLGLITPSPVVVAAITSAIRPDGIDSFVALTQGVLCVLVFVCFEAGIVHWLAALGHESLSESASYDFHSLLSVPVPAGETLLSRDQQPRGEQDRQD